MYRCCFSIRVDEGNYDQSWSIIWKLKYNLYWPANESLNISLILLNLRKWTQLFQFENRFEERGIMLLFGSKFLNSFNPLNDSLTTDILLPTSKLSFVITRCWKAFSSIAVSSKWYLSCIWIFQCASSFCHVCI